MNYKRLIMAIGQSMKIPLFVLKYGTIGAAMVAIGYLCCLWPLTCAITFFCITLVLQIIVKYGENYYE